MNARLFQPHAPASGRGGFSLLLLSARRRLAGALALTVLLWAAVFWALA